MSAKDLWETQAFLQDSCLGNCINYGLACQEFLALNFRWLPNLGPGLGKVWGGAGVSTAQFNQAAQNLELFSWWRLGELIAILIDEVVARRCRSSPWGGHGFPQFETHRIHYTGDLQSILSVLSETAGHDISQ